MSMDAIVARAMSYCLTDEAKRKRVDLRDEDDVKQLLRRANFSEREIEGLRPRAMELVNEEVSP